MHSVWFQFELPSRAYPTVLKPALVALSILAQSCCRPTAAFLADWTCQPGRCLQLFTTCVSTASRRARRTFGVALGLIHFPSALSAQLQAAEGRSSTITWC